MDPTVDSATATQNDDGTWMLDPAGMLFVYEQGAFPMDTCDDDGVFRVAAYHADPRAVLELEALRLPRTLRRTLAQRGYRLSVDEAFEDVVSRCATRPGLDPGEVWLTPRLEHAYRELQRWGHARSFEVWDGDELVGGTFGVTMGRGHTLESMFHAAPDAGTAAVLGAGVRLLDAGYRVLDVQQCTSHTARLGAHELSEAVYIRRFRASLLGGLQPALVSSERGPHDAAELVGRFRADGGATPVLPGTGWGAPVRRSSGG